MLNWVLGMTAGFNLALLLFKVWRPQSFALEIMAIGVAIVGIAVFQLAKRPEGAMRKSGGKKAA